MLSVVRPNLRARFGETEFAQALDVTLEVRVRKATAADWVGEIRQARVNGQVGERGTKAAHASVRNDGALGFGGRARGKVRELLAAQLAVKDPNRTYGVGIHVGRTYVVRVGRQELRWRGQRPGE